MICPERLSFVKFGCTDILSSLSPVPLDIDVFIHDALTVIEYEVFDVIFTDIVSLPSSENDKEVDDTSKVSVGVGLEVVFTARITAE